MTRLAELSKGKRTLLLLTIVLVICCTLALVAEAGVRLRHYIKYGALWGIEDTYEIDAHTGLRIPIAGTSVGPITINSLGFRSPEIPVAKTPGTLRVAFLGASTTYCADVSGNQMTWPDIVWRTLQRHWPKANFDYVNGSVPGYGMESSLRNFEYRIKPLHPDVIVIYEISNDLSSNTYDLAVQRGLAKKRAEQELSWPTKYSLLWYLAEKNLRILAQQSAAQNAQGKLILTPQDMQLLNERFRKDLQALVTASQQTASLVVMVTFSHRLRHDQTPKEQTDAAVTGLYYMPYLTTSGLLQGYDAYNEVTRQVAGATGSLLIDGEYSIRGDAAHFVDSVHFSDTGSRAMAHRVSTALLQSKAFTSLVQSHQPMGLVKPAP